MFAGSDQLIATGAAVRMNTRGRWLRADRRHLRLGIEQQLAGGARHAAPPALRPRRRETLLHSPPNAAALRSSRRHHLRRRAAGRSRRARRRTPPRWRPRQRRDRTAVELGTRYPITIGSAGSPPDGCWGMAAPGKHALVTRRERSAALARPLEHRWPQDVRTGAAARRAGKNLQR